MDVLIPVSAGHLIDQITILEIKKFHIADPAKQENVRRELEALSRIRADLPELAQPTILALEQELAAVNQTLWEVEDSLRAMEARQEFGAPFIAAARSVYQTNDKRSVLKRAIDRLAGSSFCEEKSFSTNT
jgi:Family of unknown function (DUF6165)